MRTYCKSIVTIGVRADFFRGGLNQFCPKNPGQRCKKLPKNCQIARKKSFCPTLRSCSPPPPGSYAYVLYLVTAAETEHSAACRGLADVECRELQGADNQARQKPLG